MNHSFVIDNSYYHARFPKTLVLAPHPDDEINLSANLIHTCTHTGGEVFVAFSNSGDWSLPAEVRFREAMASLHILGVKDENIFFMGYGDTWFSSKPEHMFTSEKEAVRSKAGHLQTYGCEGFADYSYQRRGEHSLYNATDFCRDLTDLIRQIRPELIVCVDYDEHPDHRALSLGFERALNHVLKDTPDYRPEVFKRLAYPLAYCAARDYSLNNASTKRPEVGAIDRYSGEIVGLNALQWESRIRLPISRKAITGDFRRNLVAKALKCHRSQYIYGRVGRILNGDEVYWRRRTDNAALTATVDATSGDPRYVNDFQLINATDLYAIPPVFDDYFWHPSREDTQKTIRFTWDKQTVSYLRFFGNVGGNGRIECLSIRFDDGYFQETGPFPSNGAPVEIFLDTPHVIQTCTLSVKEYSGEEYGLAECEFYENAAYRSAIAPFIKISCSGNFVYRYYVKKNAAELKLGLYAYGTESEGTAFHVIYGKSKIYGDTLVFDKSDKTIVVRSELNNANGELFDQVIIKRTSFLPVLDCLQRLKAISTEKRISLLRYRDALIRNLKSGGFLFTIKKIIYKKRA